MGEHNQKSAGGSVGRTFWARVDEGNEIIASVLSVVDENSIDNATLTCIGAINHARLITPDLANPRHDGREKEVDEPCEIMAVGNITRSDQGKAIVHLHCTLARQDTSALAGHLVSATALYFVEVSIIEELSIRAIRKQDPDTGFWVLEVE